MDMEYNKDIHEELEKLSPLLNEIPRDPVLQVPEGYFDDFAASMTAAMTDKNELPLWLETPLPAAGAVPANYFDQLPGKLLEKVKNQAQEQTPVISIFRKFRFVAAAVIAGLFVIGIWQFQNMYQNTTQLADDKELTRDFKQISFDELTKYVDLHPGNAAATDNFMASASTGTMNEDDVRLMLEDYSEEELENFLQRDAISASILN